MRAAVGQVISFAATIVAAIIIGFGVPLAWVWIGSQLQSGSGASTVNFSVAMVILFGIIITYVLLLYLAGIVLALFGPREGAGSSQPRTRMPWMRGMTDTRELKRGPTMGAIERLFVVTTMIVTVAFWLWFAFLAGSPLPNQ
ncbi:MAG: hypothetical protein EDQ89_03630 [Acidobacteria bacterium]|nr:MAG: hypothetical protein EDQ89_03630 [Acidobacteriota bacterium]GIK78639.1 MAG: hypothetical protein BroJett022_23290 [Actinomycetes bacterium]